MVELLLVFVSNFRSEMNFMSLKLLTKTNNSSTMNPYFPELSGGKKEMDKLFMLFKALMASGFL